MTTRRSQPGLCRGRRQASPAAAPTGTRTVVAGPGAPVSSPAMSGRTALVAHSGPHHPSDPEPGTNPLWPAPPHPHTAGRPRLLCGTTAGARRIGGLTAVGSHFSVCKRVRLTRDPLRPLLPDATSPHEPHVLWVRSLPSLGKLSSVTVHSYETLGNPQTHPHSTTVRLPRVGAPLSARGCRPVRFLGTRPFLHWADVRGDGAGGPRRCRPVSPHCDRRALQVGGVAPLSPEAQTLQAVVATVGRAHPPWNLSWRLAAGPASRP